MRLFAQADPERREEWPSPQTRWHLSSLRSGFEGKPAAGTAGVPRACQVLPREPPEAAQCPSAAPGPPEAGGSLPHVGTQLCFLVGLLSTKPAANAVTGLGLIRAGWHELMETPLEIYFFSFL